MTYCKEPWFIPCMPIVQGQSFFVLLYQQCLWACTQWFKMTNPPSNQMHWNWYLEMWGIRVELDDYVIVIAQLPGIYGSKPTWVRGGSPRTRAVYVAINPWQLGNKCYISHLIGPQCGARVFFHSNSYSKQTMQQRNRRDPRLFCTVPVLFWLP